MTAKKQQTIGDFTCKQCRTPFLGHLDEEPRTCGLLACRAADTWGVDDWAGQARLASARVAAGIDLNDLDRTALARTQPLPLTA